MEGGRARLERRRRVGTGRKEKKAESLLEVLSPLVDRPITVSLQKENNSSARIPCTTCAHVIACASVCVLTSRP